MSVKIFTFIITTKHYKYNEIQIISNTNEKHPFSHAETNHFHAELSSLESPYTFIKIHYHLNDISQLYHFSPLLSFHITSQSLIPVRRMMLQLLLHLATVGDGDLLGGGSTLAAIVLHLLHHVHAGYHVAEYHMLSI